MQCAISAIADHLNFMTFENHCHTSIENAFADFEIRVAYFGTDRGTKQETVTQASIICKCALNTHVYMFESQETRIPLWPFYLFLFKMLVLRAENSKN